MTLCVAAISGYGGRKPLLVIGTDWKASSGIAGAENQDKLRWVTPNIPLLLAGTISRAIQLFDTYRQYMEMLEKREPPVVLTDLNVGDIIRRPPTLLKAKLVDEYTGLKFGLSYKNFRLAVSRKEIPESVAVGAYADIRKINLDCEVILPFFVDREPYIFKVDSDGEVEECDNFAAIGSGSTIAEGSLFQRKHEDRMSLGRTVYHVYEAMRLGSIASDVGSEHTLNVLYPPGVRGEALSGDTTTKKADKFLKRKFEKFGPTQFVKMPLPRGFWHSDF